MENYSAEFKHYLTAEVKFFDVVEGVITTYDGTDIVVNSPEYNEWMSNKYKKFCALGKEATNEPIKEKISTKKLLEYIKKDPRFKELGLVATYSEMSKTISLCNPISDIVYSLSTRDLFSGNTIYIKYYTSNAPEKSLYYTNDYPSCLYVSNADEVHVILDTIIHLEESYPDRLATKLYFELKDTDVIEDSVYKNKYLINRLKEIFLEHYKEDPDIILHQFLDPTLRKIYFQLKNK